MFPTIDMVKTGQRICQLRKEKGYSVRDLQGIFGFSDPQAIYRWQWGKSLPTVDNLLILSYLFETSIDSILVVDASANESAIFYAQFSFSAYRTKYVVF